MNRTARMARLLGELKREMNGAVADAMRCEGLAGHWINYGVSLPTVWSVVARECPGKDDGFARFLYAQQVRELRLAALEIADPALLGPEELDFWGEGLFDRELAAVAAHRFFSRSPRAEELFHAGIVSQMPLLRYAARMTAARLPHADVASVLAALPETDATRLEADGTVALLAALAATDRKAVTDYLAARRTDGVWSDWVRFEMEWRLEFMRN